MKNKVANRSLHFGPLTALLMVLCLVGCQAIASPTVNPAIPSSSPSVIGTTATSTAIIPTRTATNVPPTLTAFAPTLTASAIVPAFTDTAETARPMRVHYIDVGQGDAILIQAPDGEAGLIDGGETNTGVVSYLKAQGITHLSLVVATHPHSDHIGGLVQVLQSIPTDRVVTNGEMATTATYEHLLDAIDASKAEYIEAKKGDAISLGILTFQVLSSGGVSTDDPNQNSVVLRLVYAKTTFLFMGDAGKDAEALLLASGQPLSADILKVGHHGSRTASSPAFLKQVHPKVAIYSAGMGNSYGHPHAETLAALSAVGATIYGTDVNGTVIVTGDGGGYSVQTAKQGRAQAPPTQSTAQPTTGVQNTSQPTQSGGSTGQLAISVVSLTSPIKPGATASLTIQTLPGAACSIQVHYKSGPSGAAGLGAKTADGSGNVTWSWKVGSSTAKGSWSIVVTSSLNGQSVTQTIPFVVQ